MGSGLASSLWHFRRRWKETGRQFQEFEDLKIENLKIQELCEALFGNSYVEASQCGDRGFEEPTHSIILLRPIRSLGIRSCTWDGGSCAIHKSYKRYQFQSKKWLLKKHIDNFEIFEILKTRRGNVCTWWTARCPSLPRSAQRSSRQSSPPQSDANVLVDASIPAFLYVLTGAKK